MAPAGREMCPSGNVNWEHVIQPHFPLILAHNETATQTWERLGGIIRVMIPEQSDTWRWVRRRLGNASSTIARAGDAQTWVRCPCLRRLGYALKDARRLGYADADLTGRKNSGLEIDFADLGTVMRRLGYGIGRNRADLGTILRRLGYGDAQTSERISRRLGYGFEAASRSGVSLAAAAYRRTYSITYIPYR